jgi:hypothetical protein
LGRAFFFDSGETFFPRTGTEGFNVAGDEGFKADMGLEILLNLTCLIGGNIF